MSLTGLSARTWAVEQVRQLLHAYHADSLDSETAKERLRRVATECDEAIGRPDVSDEERDRHRYLLGMIMDILTRFDSWYSGHYHPVAVRWFGMEQAFSRWFDANHVEYVGEHKPDSLVPGVSYDFILLGAVPTLIEIKYGQFGNTAMVDALARTAVAAFGRCRFLLVVIGEESEAWRTLSGVVSAIFYFNPDEVNTVGSEDEHSAVDREAGAFVANVMSSIHGVPVLEGGQRGGSGELPLQELSRWSERLAPPIQVLFPTDPLSALQTVAASFRAIVSSEDAGENVVDHELAELRAEYGSGHYTSCALRLGRCLELVVYAFARSVGISPSLGQYRPLLAVGDKLKALNSRMADLSEADPVRDNDDYTQKRGRLRDAIIDVQTSLSTVLSQLDEVAREDREVRGPDNIQAILRRSVRHLGDGPDSAEAKTRLGRLLVDDRAREIIALRNSAAHGDPNLAQREVSRTEVVEQLFAVADYIQELAVVAALSRHGIGPRA